MARTVDGVHDVPEPTQSSIAMVSPVPDVVLVTVSKAPCMIEFPGEKTMGVTVGSTTPATQIEHEGITPFGGYALTLQKEKYPGPLEPCHTASPTYVFPPPRFVSVPEPDACRVP